MYQEKALEHLKVTETKTVAVGQKMDLVFYTLQLGFFDMDFDLISKSIDKAKRYLFEYHISKIISFAILLLF
jgi:26S proteasome regulatory subunit N7